MDGQKGKPVSSYILSYHLSGLTQPTKHQRHNPKKEQLISWAQIKKQNKLLLYKKQYEENEKTVLRLRENWANNY